MTRRQKPQREQGMSWEEILQYMPIIKKIASKYSGDANLAEDVAAEVVLALYEDKRLDTSKFEKKDPAIRNTIRNKTLKILRCKKRGRIPKNIDSLDELTDLGLQVDSEGVKYFVDGSLHLSFEPRINSPFFRRPHRLEARSSDAE